MEKKVVQRFGSSVIRHLSRAGAVQNALVMDKTGTPTDYIQDGKFKLVGMDTIKLYAQQCNIRPENGWADRPETFIKKDVGYINGVALN